MPNASNLTPENRFVALFVGESGSGKTVAECSFPGKIKVEDFDGRIRGILGAPWIDKSKIDFDSYPPRRGGTGGDPNYIKINNSMETLLVSAQVGQCPYSTLVLDSLTSQTFALVCDAIPLTHKTEQGKNKGKRIGGLFMPGPEDYGFEATGTYSLMAFLRSVPISNVIVSAHFVDRFGKSDPDDPFSETVAIGKKLSVRDKIGTNIMPYFDHVFEFYRRTNRFYVKFRGELARTSYAELPDGEIDITGKDFYNEVLMHYIRNNNK